MSWKKGAQLHGFESKGKVRLSYVSMFLDNGEQFLINSRNFYLFLKPEKLAEDKESFATTSDC